MENAKVTGITPSRKPDDPVIVKIAKLGIILSDKETDIETKLLCVKACERMNYITKEEAAQLLFHRIDLERFGEQDEAE